MSVTLIGLDADDTLWHNETIFRAMQGRFAALLAPYVDAGRLEDLLAKVEHDNLSTYGYGAKGFTLSLIETALLASNDRVAAQALTEIVAMGKAMMLHPVEPLPAVEAAVARLAAMARLVLITKGDLFHQEAKLAASGLGRHFSGVEIVSAKDPDTYRRVLRRYDVAPQAFLMAGNSVRSDILPVLAIGGFAALVPYPLVWAHEEAPAPAGHVRFRQLASLDELPQWIDALRSRDEGLSDDHQRR